MSELSIIIPAYNEEESLKVLMPELLEFCGKNALKLIIVNDGSKDGTGKVLEGFAGSDGFSFFHHKVNRGYGGAIKTGIRNADTKYVITIDADGQHDLTDVIALKKTISDADADMVVGSRMAHKNASVYRGLGKWLIRSFAKLLLPIHIDDINSGMKIYDTQLAQRYIRLCPDHMAFSDIIAMVFISQRHLVLEQPINIKPRTAGVSTISTLTAIETVKEILNIVILFNPMRVFFTIAALSIAVSLAWGIPIVLRGRGVSTGAMLGFTTGMLFFFLGLIAEQLSQLRKNSVNE
ncbi:MAG: glycosyltransferase family 2 protein [Flavobacteriales bacterium]|jgi:glycosyltransferase involved in cell wall biosynthesis|nr:glycosyltransferase family 2 protein [Flavobacteriales bacterium]